MQTSFNKYLLIISQDVGTNLATMDRAINSVDAALILVGPAIQWMVQMMSLHNESNKMNKMISDICKSWRRTKVGGRNINAAARMRVVREDLSTKDALD